MKCFIKMKIYHFETIRRLFSICVNANAECRNTDNTNNRITLFTVTPNNPATTTAARFTSTRAQTQNAGKLTICRHWWGTNECDTETAPKMQCRKIIMHSNGNAVDDKHRAPRMGTRSTATVKMCVRHRTKNRHSQTESQMHRHRIESISKWLGGGVVTGRLPSASKAPANGSRN